jgi:hypothetical protein
MTSNEQAFASLVMSKGRVVYREPMFEDCDCVADFYIFNPHTGRGKVVEITLMSEHPSRRKYSRKTINRKARQREELLSTGVPVVFLYLEHQKKIRRLCCEDLF